MNLNEQYISHCTGFYNLLGWLDEQNKMGYRHSIKHSIIYLDQISSKYFSLGVQKNNSQVFFAIQPEESVWFKLIQWDKIVLRQNENCIYFVSKMMKGDNENYPDIPSFAFCLQIDSIHKMSLFKYIDKMDIREYSLNEKKELQINFHKKLVSLHIKNMQAKEMIVDNQNYLSYRDLMSKNESALLDNFGDSVPELKGDVYQSEESQKLLDKMQKVQNDTSAFFKKFKGKLF